jgi:putative flippase GtrA
MLGNKKNCKEPVVTLTEHHKGKIARVSKFGVVGAANTLIDFLLYNILSSFVGLSLVQANAISTTIAMSFSFAANKKVVFTHPKTGSLFRQTVLFFGVTAFGLYVLQTGTIKLLTDIWLAPVALGLGVAHMANINGHDQFIIKNLAKAAATVVSLTWNYIMYKKVVFS